jgi:ABC-2 type transport system ATP-binding protein
MALATDATILCFDEPTANLDPESRAVFLAALAERNPQPAILLSSHRIEELHDLVDRVVVLADGAVRFDDRLDAFLADRTLAHAAGLSAASVLPLRSRP